MNEFILVSMDRKNKTEKELRRNAEYSYSAYCVAATNNDIAASSLAASASASFAAASSVACILEERLDTYFEITGEDKQEYINEIKGNK